MPGKRSKTKRRRAGPSDASSTPYDDVFKTLLVDHPSLIIAVVELAFGLGYDGTERVELRSNEHFVTGSDEGHSGVRQRKRVTDCSFVIWRGDERRSYLIECQLEPDGTILIRIFEYATQVALEEAVFEDGVLKVCFPRIALLYLRSWSTTPDAMTVQIELPTGRMPECRQGDSPSPRGGMSRLSCRPDGATVSFEVPVIKVKDYGLDELFEKDLLFLLPYYIFRHEARLSEIEGDAEAADAKDGTSCPRVGTRTSCPSPRRNQNDSRSCRAPRSRSHQLLRSWGGPSGAVIMIAR